MENSKKSITLTIAVKEIDKVIEKVEKLICLLKEAKSLTDDLAAIDMKLLREIDIQG